MATKAPEPSVQSEEIDVVFPFDSREMQSRHDAQDDPTGPNRADVTASTDGTDTLVATVFAGEQERWSLDFTVDSGHVEITRAYRDGMRIDVQKLPSWMTLVQRALKNHLQNGQ